MTAPEWTRLENSAIIYPSCQTRKYSTVYKMSVTMDSPVDPWKLQEALRSVTARFPGFRYTLRRGLFWWFLQRLENEPTVSTDTTLRPVDIERNGGYMFKLGCNGNRIDLVVFHALTDGTGAATFLMSVAGEYLRITGHPEIGYGKWVFDPDSRGDQEELEDSFDRFSGTKGALDKEESAWHIEGTEEKDNSVNTVKVSLSSSALTAKAHELGCTVTELLSTLIMLSLQDVRRQQKGKKGFIRMELPVNLRPIYGSCTMRNFSSYIYLTLDVNNGEFSFDEALREIKYQKRLYTGESRLTRRIAANVALEDSLAIRCIPIFIKKPIINLINFLKGDNYATYTFSNLGNVTLPEGMEDKVRDMDFILGRQRRRSGSCSCVSVGDTTSINFSRKIVEDDLERRFVERLRSLGLHTSVQVPFEQKEKTATPKTVKPILSKKSYFLPTFLLSF